MTALPNFFHPIANEVAGMIHWDGENFSHSADNVEFSIEGGGEVPVLRCRCRDVDGNEHNRDVNLSERIENQNGQFVYR